MDTTTGNDTSAGSLLSRCSVYVSEKYRKATAVSADGTRRSIYFDLCGIVDRTELPMHFGNGVWEMQSFDHSDVFCIRIFDDGSLFVESVVNDPFVLFEAKIQSPEGLDSIIAFLRTGNDKTVMGKLVVLPDVMSDNER